MNLPEDLYFYFPLELGTACKKFYKKINIYNRYIVVTGDPRADYIDYKKLKRIDLTKLPKREIGIILTKIKPVEIVLDRLDFISSLCVKKTKKIEINTGKYNDVMLSDQNNLKILHMLQRKNIKVIISHAYTGLCAKINIPNLTNVIIETCSGISLAGFENVVKNIKIKNIYVYPNQLNFNWTTVLNNYKDIIIDYYVYNDDELPDLERIISETTNFIRVYYVNNFTLLDGLKKYLDSGRISVEHTETSLQVPARKAPKIDPDAYVSDEETEEVILNSESDEDIEQHCIFDMLGQHSENEEEIQEPVSPKFEDENIDNEEQIAIYRSITE